MSLPVCVPPAPVSRPSGLLFLPGQAPPLKLISSTLYFLLTYPGFKFSTPVLDGGQGNHDQEWSWETVYGVDVLQHRHYLHRLAETLW